MATEIEIKVPDIGGAKDVEIIEVLVTPGSQIVQGSSLITLESDKASMEIPATQAGTVGTLKIKVGDKVSAGDIILTLIVEEANLKPSVPATAEREESKKSQLQSQMPSTSTQQIEIQVPDIGGAANVDVIEIRVKEGSLIAKDEPLITLESDKATMEVPAPVAGTVASVKLQVGDKVSAGAVILVLNTDDEESLTKVPLSSSLPEHPITNSDETLLSTNLQPNESHHLAATAVAAVYAGPAVRRLARELGVNLAEVKGSGRKNRIIDEDVKTFVKTKLVGQQFTSLPFQLIASPPIDFGKFGSTISKPLHKIKRLTGTNVHRSWVTIPHVTQFDEADITELESFRQSAAEKAKQAGYKLTILAFVSKVVCKALAVFPQFNASLDSSGENLIMKQYYNIGIAAETANGLVVPVVKGVDQLSVSEIALEMGRLSTNAREKKLTTDEMSGGCFTISSLGGIGGTAFTPIVNSPEVAILGLSRAVMKPIFIDSSFQPRLMLPLSLSYDHRVIDGAEAARFTCFIAENLADIRRVLL